MLTKIVRHIYEGSNNQIRIVRLMKLCLTELYILFDRYV